jgi:AGZA family xanthine/uracil permease-like MFS transporter
MEKGKTNAALGSFAKKLDAYFGITASGSSLKTELIAGAATFMTMCYILVVNAGMIGGTLLGDGGFGAIYIATALSAIFGTLMLGLFAKLPFAQAPGMGLNAFFTFSVCRGLGVSYGTALFIVLISGALFFALSIGGIREKIVEGLPGCIKLAISAGIGAFIAFIGFQNAKIIVDDPATLVKLVDFTQLFKTGAGQGVALNAIVCVATFLGIVVMSKKNIKASIILGLLGGSVLYYLLQLIVFKKISEDLSLASPFAAFGAFGSKAFFKFEVKGLFTNFKAFMNFVSLVIAFAIVDMFDTIGTLVGTCTRAGMMDKDGNVPNMRKALISDSAATMVGAVLGTSTVTTYVESAAGVSAGGRTGFTSVVVAALFFIAMFLSPIASLIPGPAAAAALIYVGVLMMSSVKEIDWHDPAVGACCLMTVLGMPLTYSISNGIGLGIITYVVVKAVTGKIKDVKLFTYIIAAIFLLKFFVVG